MGGFGVRFCVLTHSRNIPDDALCVLNFCVTWRFSIVLHHTHSRPVNLLGQLATPIEVELASTIHRTYICTLGHYVTYPYRGTPASVNQLPRPPPSPGRSSGRQGPAAERDSGAPLPEAWRHLRARGPARRRLARREEPYGRGGAAQDAERGRLVRRVQLVGRRRGEGQRK